jgi:hypothetical protein
MEEDFEAPDNSIDVFEIIINGESRIFRFVTELKQAGREVTEDEIILDGKSREYDFYSIVKISKKRNDEYIKTHTRCYGVAVVIDKLVEVGDNANFNNWNAENDENNFYE